MIKANELEVAAAEVHLQKAVHAGNLRVAGEPFANEGGFPVPVSTCIGMPLCSVTASMKSMPLMASRTALVATMRIAAGWYSRARCADPEWCSGRRTWPPVSGQLAADACTDAGLDCFRKHGLDRVEVVPFCATRSLIELLPTSMTATGGLDCIQ